MRSDDETAQTLDELGVSKQRSSTWQKLAEASDKQFETAREREASVDPHHVKLGRQIVQGPDSKLKPGFPGEDEKAPKPPQNTRKRAGPAHHRRRPRAPRPAAGAVDFASSPQCRGAAAASELDAEHSIHDAPMPENRKVAR